MVVILQIYMIFLRADKEDKRLSLVWLAQLEPTQNDVLSM